MKRLSCGGKGPCCHVGYQHRHCEHCDMVIDTRSWTYPAYPIYPVYPSYPTIYPTWYSGGGYDIRTAAGPLALKAAAGQWGTALPEHVCTEPTA